MFCLPRIDTLHFSLFQLQEAGQGAPLPSIIDLRVFYFVTQPFVLSVVVALLVSKDFRIKTDLTSILRVYRDPKSSVEESCAQK